MTPLGHNSRLPTAFFFNVLFDHIMSYDFDTLYRTWATQFSDTCPDLEPTVKRFIGQMYAMTDDPDDITDDVLFVLDYVQERDKSEPTWTETYSLPE